MRTRLLITGLLTAFLHLALPALAADTPVRPNFLFIMTDDQSWAFTSKAGYGFVKTPNFDRIANEGIYFARAYAAAPTCTASRSALLTGTPVWKTESGALLQGQWPEQLKTFPYMLKDAGYFTGYTGKGWGPGKFNYAADPIAKAYNDVFKKDYKDKPEWTVWDMPANLNVFLDAKPADAPFFFWVGSFEPHRPYVKPDTRRFDGKDPKDFMPGFFPDTPEMRNSLSSYLIETERFDKDLGDIVNILKKRGLLENTVIVVTSDNGADLPRAKPQIYEYGARVPLAIRWGAGIRQPGRDVTDTVSLLDIAPTFLELARVAIPPAMRGHSLADVFSTPQFKERTPAFLGMDRHSGWRKKEQTYPVRAVYTRQYAYIRNYFPDRWPAGDPPVFAEATQEWLRDAKGQPVEPWYSLATAKRPREELYDLAKDPNQFHNVAEDKEYKSIRKELSKRLDKELKESGDPVHLTGKDYFAKFITPDMIQQYNWPPQ